MEPQAINPGRIIRLAYVLGVGRSGSTLLDMLLGSMEGVHSVGEVWALGKWITQNKTCSCDMPVLSCPIWSVIADDINTQCTWSVEDLYSGNRPHRRRYAEMIALFNERYLSPYNAAQVDQYARKEHRVFLRLTEVTGAHLFVDSSKRLDRLVRLASSSYFDVQVIHLVRNGLAQVEAARRAKSRDIYKKRVIPPRIILGWIVQMQNQLRFLDRMIPPEKVLRIDYRFLAQNPFDALAKICDFLKIKFDGSVVDQESDRYVFRQMHHLIGGNRLTSSPPDTLIKYDPSWENRLHRWDTLWFSLLGGPLMNKRLGIE